MATNNYKQSRLRINQQKKEAKGLRKKLVKTRTSEEQIFEHILNEAGIHYEIQKYIRVKKRMSFPDFFIPKGKILVEIDGEYHNEKKQKEWDEYKERQWRKQRYKVVRFTNDEIYNLSNSEILQRIKEAV